MTTGEVALVGDLVVTEPAKGWVPKAASGVLQRMGAEGCLRCTPLRRKRVGVRRPMRDRPGWFFCRMGGGDFGTSLGAAAHMGAIFCCVHGGVAAS
ncbi:hypothetical protein QV65_01525, partial [Rhodococcus erythropolis]